jgi:pyrroline-5-carboxylate reductase
MTAPDFDGSITVSPKNAAIVAQLRAEFPALSVGESNQDVLDRSDLLLLTVRPQTSAEIISQLRFRPGHRVVSAIAAFSLQQLSELVAPAHTVIRSIPLPTVAQRRGVTVLFPSDPEVNQLFESLGSALPVADEFEFSAMSAATAVVASYAALAQTTASWLCAHGLERLEARSYVSALLAGIVDAAEHSNESFADIAESHATKGGLNEQLRLFLEEKGLFASLADGLDLVMARVTGNVRAAQDFEQAAAGQ